MGKPKKGVLAGDASEPKVEAPKAPEILGYLGPKARRVPVHFKGIRHINGRDYHELHCIDGSVYVLNDEDVANQLKSSPDAE